MPDNLTPEDRRKTMQAVKGKGTSLERRLFAMLAGMRLQGWKKNVSTIVGKPDAVFPEERVIVFVDGCFWHGCPICNRKLPETNREYWVQKIGRNVERDRINTRLLIEDGWQVIRIWEHQMRNPADRREIRLKIRRATNRGKAGTESGKTAG